jgi:hypothetical protein
MDLEHEKRLTETESRAKSNTRRIDECEKRQDNLEELVTTVKVLADREARVEEDVGEIKNDVKSLTSKPGKRWDKLIDNVLWGIVGAVLAFLLARIGL